MIGILKYFKLFFRDLPFYKSLDADTGEEGKRLRIYLTHPSQILFQKEIDKWLKVAYENNIVDNFKQRLLRKVTFSSLQSILNELMVAYYFSHYLKMKIKEYNPSAKKKRSGEWIFEKNSRGMFVEVKSPWEERRIGTYGYSHYDKLRNKIIKAYRQKPSRCIPFIIIITDDLNLGLAFYNEQLLDILYGDRALCFSGPRDGSLKYLGYKVIGKRGIFQKRRKPRLSGVATLSYRVLFNIELKKDEGNYHFALYHNPNCDAKCRLAFNWFKPYKQYLSHYKTV